MAEGNVKIRRALVSVTDKKDLVGFVKHLRRHGVEIVSTGGTAKALKAEGVPVIEISDFTGFPEMFEGRVKTLHPRVHGGLLFKRGNTLHEGEATQNGIDPIDMIVVNLYRFEETVAKPGCTREDAIENIDIGGPAMLRSAAKNHASVTVVTSPAQYSAVLAEMESTDGCTTLETRKMLAREAFFHTACYDGAIANYLGEGECMCMSGRKVVDLPKGENGYQKPAALYVHSGADNPFGLDKYQVLEGAPLSYVNYTDIDRLHQTVALVSNAWTRVGKSPHIAVGVKHGNPCGAAVGGDMHSVAVKAATGNTLSMFGGVMMCNFTLDEETAHLLVTAGMNGLVQKFDSIIAPDFEPGAIEVFKRPKGRCRVVRGPIDLGIIPPINRKRFRQVEGGFLVQPDYSFVPNLGVGEEVWNQPYLMDLLLAICIAWRSNSNTISIVRDCMLLGNGVGQMDRVGAAKLAVQRAIEAGHIDKLEGSSAASDSFFPQPDAPQVLIDAGVTHIFSTSGSINDKLTQDLCAKRGIKLVQLPDSETRGFFGH